MADATKPTTALEKAQQLQDTLASAELHIVDSQKQFDIRTSTGEETTRLPLAFGDGGGLVDPASISLDLAAQLVSPSVFPMSNASLTKLSFAGLLPEAQVSVSRAESQGFVHQDHRER